LTGGDSCKTLQEAIVDPTTSFISNGGTGEKIQKGRTNIWNSQFHPQIFSNFQQKLNFILKLLK
jgi:hypothetical protein